MEDASFERPSGKRGKPKKPKKLSMADTIKLQEATKHERLAETHASHAEELSSSSTSSFL